MSPKAERTAATAAAAAGDSSNASAASSSSDINLLSPQSAERRASTVQANVDDAAVAIVPAAPGAAAAVASDVKVVKPLKVRLPVTKDQMLRRHQDIVQKSFDTFMALDRDGDRQIGIVELGSFLRHYSNVISVSESDAAAIMELAAGPGTETLNFSEFHSIFSAIQICCQLQSSDLAHLRVKDVRDSLIKAGLNPTKSQVESMFLLGDNYATYDKRGPVHFLDFFRVFHHTRSTTDAHDLFLHSWFHAGRNSTPYNKPVEISPAQDFIAGTLAGIALTLTGHPFDTIKVRLQTQSGMYKGGLDCLKQTVTKEGFLALYKGMAGPMLTIPLVNAVVFAAYAHAKDWMHKLQIKPAPLNLFEISLAGAFAGLVNSVIVSPVELIKTRLQIQHEAALSISLSKVKTSFYSPSYNSIPLGTVVTPPWSGLGPKPAVAADLVFSGPWDCFQKILNQNGVKGLFRGMSATIYREIPGYGSQFFMYEALKRSLTREGEKVQDLGAVPLIMAGGTAGIFGWIWSYPMDYIKSQIQAEPYNQRTLFKKHPWLFDGGFISCWKMTVAAGGHKALWKGFGTCAARAFPANAAGFLAYEWGLNQIRDAEVL